jgi:hypothetical protein
VVGAAGNEWYWNNEINPAEQDHWSRPASQFERHGLRRRALVVGSHGGHHGGASVAQFCRCLPLEKWTNQVGETK